MRGAIAAIITSLILAFFTKKVNVERDSQTKSINNFTVAASKMVPVIFQCLAWAFLAIISFVVVWNWVRWHDYDPRFWWLGLGFAGVTIPLSIVCAIWKVKVQGEEITYTNFVGITKRTTFGKVDKVLITDNRSYIIYANGKRFGTINSDFLCIDNFLRRCEKENIEVRPKSYRCLTKLTLYLKSMKMMFGIAVVAFIIMLLFVGYYFLKGVYNLLDTLLLSSMISIFLIALTAPLPLRGILQIIRQEHSLGFSFKDEMKEHNVQGAHFKNEVWFIDSSLTHIVAFRRDYIKGTGAINKGSGGDNSKMKIMTVDGKTVKASSGNMTISDLRSWYRNPPAR